jgi:hypothetical protein
VGAVSAEIFLFLAGETPSIAGMVVCGSVMFGMVVSREGLLNMWNNKKSISYATKISITAQAHGELSFLDMLLPMRRIWLRETILW